jgi:hypothetical protein
MARKKRKGKDQEPPSIIKDEPKAVYNTIKFLLKKLASPELQAKLEGVVSQCHQIVTLTCDFSKLFVLHEHMHNHPLPMLDEDFYETAIRVICCKKGNAGRPFSQNRDLYEVMLKFHQEHFAPLSPKNSRIQVANISHILSYVASTLATVQQTNITMNFPQYIRRYVNSYFRRRWYQEHGWASDYKMTSTESYNFRQTIKPIKEDILFCRRWREGGYRSDPQFHPWLDSVVNVLYPEPSGEIFDTGVYYDVHVRPFEYLKYMLAMNLQFEEWGTKMYSPLCLRSSLSPQYIKIDTTALIDLMVTDKDIEALRLILDLPMLKSKGQLFGSFSKLRGSDVSKTESFRLNTEIWKYFFKFETNKYTRKLLERGSYVFDNSILTDGVGVSVLQVRSDRVGFCCKANNSKALRFVPEDVPYLSELTEEERDYLLHETNNIANDPGKGDISYLTGSSGKRLRYTSQQRAVECRFKKNKRAMVAMKQKSICSNGKTVESNENTVVYVSRTCDFHRFKQYISGRRDLESLVVPAMYLRQTIRKLRFSAQAHIKQSEDRFINKIMKIFSTEEKPRVTIAWGDWSHPQHMRNFAPVPGVGFRKRILKKGRARGLYGGLVHESYTSCTCHDCHGRTGYFKTRSYIKNDVIRTVNVHGLLRCQNEKCSKLWNRNVLGSTNIREVALAVLRGEPRPVQFTIAHPSHAAAANGAA